MSVPVPRQRSAACGPGGPARPAAEAYAACGAPTGAAMPHREAAVAGFPTGAGHADATAAGAGRPPEPTAAAPADRAPGGGEAGEPREPTAPEQPAKAGPHTESALPAGSGPHMEPEASVSAAPAGHGPTLLVVGADQTRSLPEMRDWLGRRTRVRTARNLTETRRLLTDDVDCILLDLAPPDVVREDGTPPHGVPQVQRAVAPRSEAPAPAPELELDVLREVLSLAPHHAVLVLTAEADAERAVEAVRIGAQDYLFRDELDGGVLSRAVRYAMARKRADRAQRQLTESRLRAEENARLERGLLPKPILDGSHLRFASRYRPGRSRALLGGDFWDTVRTEDGTVHAMIGDVAGHGPDEAALGVELRIAWRALTFAGLCGDALLGTLHDVLENERADEETFATLCTVDIAPDGSSAGVCLAGHPSPLVTGPGRRPWLLPPESGGPALGLLPGARWPRHQVTLGGSWSLLMYTDGLVEGHVGAGSERLGQEGLARLVGDHLAAGLRGEDLLDAAMADARDLNGGELTDDVAALLLGRG